MDGPVNSGSVFPVLQPQPAEAAGAEPGDADTQIGADQGGVVHCDISCGQAVVSRGPVRLRIRSAGGACTSARRDCRPNRFSTGAGLSNPPLPPPRNPNDLTATTPPRLRPTGRKSGTTRHLRHAERTRIRQEVLRAGDVPLSVGRIHMGHVRNYTMGDVVARVKRARVFRCCIRWAGTPSACRPRTPPWSARSTRKAWTTSEHLGDEGAAQVDGAVARLEPRDRDMRSGVLQAPAENVSRLPARRPGRAQTVEGELGTRSTTPCSPTSR